MRKSKSTVTVEEKKAIAMIFGNSAERDYVKESAHRESNIQGLKFEKFLENHQVKEACYD